MKQFRNTVIRAGLEALYFSGAHILLRPILGGVGTIFTLHHVRPPRASWRVGVMAEELWRRL